MSSSEITEYDLDLISVSDDHRRIVTPYEMMLLGKDGRRYFKVELPEEANVNFAKMLQAMKYSMVEAEDQ